MQIIDSSPLDNVSQNNREFNIKNMFQAGIHLLW